MKATYLQRMENSISEITSPNATDSLMQNLAMLANSTERWNGIRTLPTNENHGPVLLLDYIEHT